MVSVVSTHALLHFLWVFDFVQAFTLLQNLHALFLVFFFLFFSFNKQPAIFFVKAQTESEIKIACTTTIMARRAKIK